MNGVLKLVRARCLTSSVVRQTWFQTQGVSRDLIIGVTGTQPRFRAHAWLDGDPAWQASGYKEIARRAPDEPLVPPPVAGGLA